MTGELMPGAELSRWGVRGWLIVATAFAVGFLNFPLRVVGANGEYLPGDGLDNRLNNFILEHGYRYLTGRVDSFWDASAFYPARGVTALSDAHIGMLPFYSAFRVAGLSPEGAFQGYFLVGFALNFAAAAWAIRRLEFGPVGAAAGAYVFAFGLPLVAQLGHVQLFPRFLVPLAVVFAWEFLRQPRTWRLAAVAGCLVGQWYLTVYVGYFLALLLAVGCLVVVARFGRELPWRELIRPACGVWVARAGVAVGAAVSFLPLVLAHAGEAGGVPADVVHGIAPRLAMWVTPSDLAAAYPELGTMTGLATRVAGGELQLFPGIVPILAVAVGLLLLIRPGRFGGRWSAAAVAAWSAVLLAAFVTRFGDVWLYESVLNLPGSNTIRAVGRVVMVLLFPAGVAVAVLVEALVGAALRVGRVPGALATVVVLVGVATDQWLMPTDGAREADWRTTRYSREFVQARQARLAEAIRRHPAPRTVYVFPSAAGSEQFGPFILQIEAMRAAQDVDVACVNGYSGYFAAGWARFPGYRGLMVWLRENRVSADVLDGLVVIGEPVPDADPAYEAAMRARFPPQPVGGLSK